MKTSVKPAGGCGRAGFTFVDADGNLTQVSWRTLRERHEAFYVHDGSGWRRVTSLAAAEKLTAGSGLLRAAIAPLGADVAVLDASARTMPASLLASDGAARVARARQLLEIPYTVLGRTQVWSALDNGERSAIHELRRSGTPLSDLDLLDVLDQRKTAVAPAPATVVAKFADTLLAVLPATVAIDEYRLGLDRSSTVFNHIVDGRVNPDDLALLLGASSARFFPVGWSSNESLPADLAAILAEHADAPDPLAAALAAVFHIPLADRARMLETFALVSAGAIDADAAATLAGQLAETGPLTDELLHLTGLVLLRSGGDTELALTLAGAYRDDPDAVLREHGSATLLLAAKLPELPAAARSKALDLLGLPANTQPTAEHLAVLDSIDPELFATVQALVADAPGGDGPGNVDFVLRAIAAFGPRAPEWLMKTASSPTIDRLRLAERLPSADQAASRVRQLQEVLATPPPNEQAQAQAQAASELLGTLAAPTRDREHARFLTSLAASLKADDGSANHALRSIADPAVLLGLLAAPAELATRLADVDSPEADALKRACANGADQLATAAAVRKFLAANGDPALLLARGAADLAADATVLAAPADAAALAAFSAAALHPGLLVGLLPTAAAANKRAKALADHPDDALAAREHRFLVEYSKLLKTDPQAAEAYASEALADPDLAVRLLPAPKTVSSALASLRGDLETPAERDVRLAGISAELATWSRYCDALVSGDTNEATAAGLELFPERDAHRVSVHDALYWLPADPRRAQTPTGERFGDWLLTADRGTSALRTDTGRRSLALAAEAWDTYGSRDALIKDLADEVLAREFGGHRDELSLFFVANKISRDSAQLSLQPLRSSRETPTVLPLDAVFTDAATGVRGYFLPRTDPRGIQAGVFTDCCQHPTSAGASCAYTGQMHPSSGFFVVEDAHGTILAQSWVWAADGATAQDGTTAPPGVIFDNIEARIAGRQDGATAIRAVYDQAADALADRFGRVLIGARNDIPCDDLMLLNTEDHLDSATIGYTGYNDSSGQRLYRTATPSGPRFVGLPDGFRVIEGASSVLVTASGGVELSSPDARALAERALAGSTLREYRIERDGIPTGETFTAGTRSSLALDLDPYAAPDSYSSYAPELVTRTAERTGLTEDEADRWLRLAGGDVELAARAAASDITADEYLVLAHRARELGRLPVIPQAVTDLAVARPEHATAIREAFLSSWGANPSRTETAFASPMLLELVTTPAALDRYGALAPDAVTAITDALPFLATREPSEREPLVEGLLRLRRATGPAADAGSIELLRGVEDCTARELDPSEVATLALLAPRYGAHTTSAITDPATRERFAALDVYERAKIRDTVSNELQETARYSGVDLDTASEFANEERVWLRHTAVRGAPSSQDPRHLLRYLQQLPVTADSPLPEVRELAASDHAPGSYDHGAAEQLALKAVAARYRAAHGYFDANAAPATADSDVTYRSYVDGSPSSLSHDQLTEILAVDFDELAEKVAALCLDRRYGEGVKPYAFPPASIPRIAATPPAELKELADVVKLAGRHGSHLAATLDAGLTREHLDALVRPDDEKISAPLLVEALSSGATPAEIRDLVEPGMPLGLFHALLAKPTLRDAWHDEPSRPVVKAVAGLVGPVIDAETATWAVSLASRSDRHRAGVIAAAEAAAAGSSDDLATRLVELAGLQAPLGGVLREPPV